LRAVLQYHEGTDVVTAGRGMTEAPGTVAGGDVGLLEAQTQDLRSFSAGTKIGSRYIGASYGIHIHAPDRATVPASELLSASCMRPADLILFTPASRCVPR